MVGRRLQRHDPNQLELKLAYDIVPGKRTQRYGVDAFLFIPRTLGLTPATYPKQRFFEDTSAFVRMKTPSVTLHALGSQDGEAWFTRASGPIREVMGGNVSQVGDAARGLKLLGCIYRRAIVDESAAIGDALMALQSGAPAARKAREAQLTRQLEIFLSDLENAFAQLQKLGELSERPTLPDRLRDIWQAVDEYVALTAEEACTGLVETLDHLRDGAVNGLRDRTAQLAVTMYAHRRGKDYPSYIHPGEDNEQFPFRQHLLKRIVSSVLFLEVRESESGQFASNMIGMVAAAAAMLFAVVVTIWAQSVYDMASLYFIGIAVASYMVKDRIKEHGKRILGQRVARILPDKVVEVRDLETGTLIGKCQEAVQVLNSTELVDPAVMALRHIDHTSTTATDGRPETVVRYTKQMSLNSQALAGRNTSSPALNDIIRFNLHRLRSRMEEPSEIHNIVDPKTLKIVGVRCDRVYHVNLVLRFTTEAKGLTRTETERVRVVLDRNGIRRVEPIGRSSRLATVERAAAEEEGHSSTYTA